jgi:hypothetical protein
MARLEKIEQEMQRARERIAEWQSKLKGLDGQRTEQENLQIIQAVRALKLTRDELAAFISGGILPQTMDAAIPAARYSRKKRGDETPDYGATDYEPTADTTIYESEDNSHEA